MCYSLHQLQHVMSVLSANRDTQEEMSLITAAVSHPEAL